MTATYLTVRCSSQTSDLPSLPLSVLPTAGFKHRSSAQTDLGASFLILLRYQKFEGQIFRIFFMPCVCRYQAVVSGFRGLRLATGESLGVLFPERFAPTSQTVP